MQSIKNILLKGSENRDMLVDIFYKDNGFLKPIVIYIHGFNGFKDWGNFDLIAQQFAANGFVFIKMNLSHNGTTPDFPEEFADLNAYGNNNYTKELFDVEQIINWVVDEKNSYKSHFDINQISLIGHSRGGGIAILKSSEDDRIKSLITWASVHECKSPWNRWSVEQMKEWQTKGVQYITNKRTNQQLPIYYQLFENYIDFQKRLDIEKNIQNISIPILICHGTKDEAVPYLAAEKLKEWQPKATLFLLESDHVFDRKHPWFDTSLPPAMQTVVNESILFLKKFATFNSSKS
jgi:pimeloyl-ACP methyl ester carboxylesterase